MKQKKDDVLGLPESMMPDRGHRTGLGPKGHESSGRSRKHFTSRTATYVIVGAVVLAILVYIPTYIKNHKKQISSKLLLKLIELTRRVSIEGAGYPAFALFLIEMGEN